MYVCSGVCIEVCICIFCSLCSTQTFTEEEMNKFEEGYEDYYDYEYDKEGNIVGFKTRPRNDDTKSSDQPAPQKPPGICYCVIVCEYL